jgi:hypothetical protein
MLEPDHIRGTPLDMDQYTRLFGTARIPTEVIINPNFLQVTGSDLYSQRGCKMLTKADSQHIVVLRRGQFCDYGTTSYMKMGSYSGKLQTGLMLWMTRIGRF